METAAPLFEELGDNQAAFDVLLGLTRYLATNNVGTIDVRRAMRYFKKAEALLAGRPSRCVTQISTALWPRPVTGWNGSAMGSQSRPTTPSRASIGETER